MAKVPWLSISAQGTYHHMEQSVAVVVGGCVEGEESFLGPLGLRISGKVFSDGFCCAL